MNRPRYRAHRLATLLLHALSHRFVPAPQPGNNVVHLRVVVQNPGSSASGSLTVIDRTGAITRIPYSWSPASVTAERQLDLSQCIGRTTDTTTTVTNTCSDPVVVAAIITGGNPAVTVQSVPLPAVIAPGQQFTVNVRFTPSSVGTVRDTVVMQLPCLTVKVAVTQQPASNASP